MAFNVALLERRLAALESNRGTSLRYGTVVGVDSASGTARVQLPDGEDMISMPLRVLQKRALKDQTQCLPDIGEPVACLFSGQGFEQGVILGASYSTKHPCPGKDAGQDYTRYEDGTELWYDRATHKLIARVQGDVELEATGRISLKADKDISLQSVTSISLKAPSIALAGNLSWDGHDGGAANGELHGSLTVRDGGIAVPDRDVSAGAVSLRGHTHTDVENGDGTSGAPVGGA